MRKIFTVLLFLTVFNALGQNQGINNWWLLGYGSYVGAPNGHTDMNFYTGAPIISSDSIEMDINRTAATISDSLGNLLFYTNGYYIADMTNDTMQNGNNISPTSYYNQFPNGLTVPQACLILPKPGSLKTYILFHSTLDNAPYYNKAYYLYTSIIDMNLNGGLGGVINKNTILLQDTLNPGKITSCKHANGRDWWIIVQRVNSNTYYKFLLTPTGITGPFPQNIGTPRTWTGGMTSFSTDGKKYAYYYTMGNGMGGLDIGDFDRCTGMLNNPIHIAIQTNVDFSGGLAFSPNSRFLYVTNIDSVYQFDMASTNIETSKQIVAVWDGFYSPNPPFATLFEIPQLAPDGKIYISTGNSTFHIHVINSPDSIGLACNLVQHAIQFQYFYFSGQPNHPNYFLGCDTSCTPCLVGLPSGSELFHSVKAFPNPTDGAFTLQFPVQSTAGMLEVYDVMGKLVYKDYIAPWSQYKKVDLTPSLSKREGVKANGIYFCKLKWKDKEASVKVVVER
jgi:hypothetical protein